MGKGINCSPSKTRKGKIRADNSSEKATDSEASLVKQKTQTKQSSPVKEKANADWRKDFKGKNGELNSTDNPPGSDEINSDFPFVNTLEMNKGELMVLMMKLLKLLTVKGSISLRSKPTWWPEDIQWGVLESLNTLELVTVIKRCYEAYGKENKVTSVCVRSPAVESANLKKDSGWKTAPLVKPAVNYSPQSPIVRRRPKDLYLPFAVEIYICYFCEKEFVDKEIMRHHQKYCEEKPLELIFPRVIKPADRSEPTFAPLKNSPKSPKLRLDVNRKFVPLKEFMDYLGLVQSQTAFRIKAQRKCSEISSDILEDAEPLSPSIPQTPRTPKSLISQLSRDEPGGIAKKRLSYSLSVEKRGDRNGSDMEVESSDTEADTETEKPKSTNLLNIPITSLLGQKIQKYVQVDTSMPVLTNSESFCKTPTKNSFLEKLRKKPTLYPITYKPRRGVKLEKQNHLYKFTKKERTDFYRKLVTGLNSKSRKTLRQVKKSTVRLKRLTEDTILKWMSKGKMERQLYKRYRKLCVETTTDRPAIDEFPAGPTLLSKNMDKLLGLRKSSKSDNALSLSNYVSEYVDAEVSKLQLTLYKCLLYEMSVLKPTVLINDLQGNFQQNSHETVENKIEQLESAKQSAVVSGECISKSLESGHKKDIVNNKVPKTQHQEIQQAHQNTPTIRQLLASPCVVERRSVIETFQAKVFNKNTTSPQNTTTKLVKNTASSIHSPETCDESLSVISLSSESDSFGSDCCMNCKAEGGKKTKVKIRELDSESSRKVILEPSSVNKVNFTNLTVNVDGNRDLLLQKPEKIVNISGMPSPSSSSEESMDLTSPSPTLKVESVECIDRLRPRSVKKSDSSKLVEVKKPGKIENEKQSSQVSGMISDHEKFKSLKTRAKSLTPSSSPKKQTEPSSTSLPNTPKKHKSEGSGSEMPNLTQDKSGRLLRHSASKLESCESTPISRWSNSCLLRPRNSSASSAAKLSPIKSVSSLELYKSSSQCGDVSHSSPLRSAKRLRSLDFDMLTTGLKRQRMSWSCSPRK